MNLTINMPSGVIHVKKPDCIGAWYRLYVPEFKRQVIATCIDATPDGQPKRMRIQKSLEHGGDVLMTHQYEILEKDPAWED